MTAPNGSTWVSLQAPYEWRQARLDSNVAYDEGRGVLELLPVVAPVVDTELPWQPAPADEDTLSPDTLTADDGTQYRADPVMNRIMRRRPFDTRFLPMPGVGGAGWETGRLNTPRGLAFGPAELLYVADSGNYRVQAVRLVDGSVAAVLGAQDPFGRPLQGSTGGAMSEPVDVAVDGPRARIFVADRKGRCIHVLTGHHTYLRSFKPVPSDGDAVDLRPVAVAVEPDGSVLVATDGWPRLIHAGADGSGLPDVSLDATTNPRFLGMTVGRSYPSDGYAVARLDSQVHDSTWNRVLVDADVPEGTSIEVRTYATNDPGDSPTDAPSGGPRWAPPAPVAIPLAGIEGATGEYDRAVLSWTDPAPVSGPVAAPVADVDATDRGRYLWVQLRLRGPSDLAASAPRATATPSVRSVKAQFPRQSYFGLLPKAYQERSPEDPPGALFLDRLLSMFEKELSRFSLLHEEFSRQLNFGAADEKWLPWLASWINVSFDPSWTVARRRSFLGQAVGLYQRRGTLGAISQYLRLYTGTDPLILEDFTFRPVATAVLGGSSILGLAQLGQRGNLVAGQVAAPYQDTAFQFSVWLYVDPGQDNSVVEKVASVILDAQTPAHTSYSLVLVAPEASVTVRSQVGFDLVVGKGEERTTTLYRQGETGNRNSVLGSSVFVSHTAPWSSATLLDEMGAPIDRSFVLG
jgi:phage tail-like protein